MKDEQMINGVWEINEINEMREENKKRGKISQRQINLFRQQTGCCFCCCCWRRLLAERVLRDMVNWVKKRFIGEGTNWGAYKGLNKRSQQDK